MTTNTDASFGVFCPGQLDVLSIGKGDLTLTMDGEHPEDMERARELITEMLRKGYSIYVETDAGPERVTQFNPWRMTYTITTGDDPPEAPSEPEPPTTPAKKTAKKRGRPRKEVPVAGSKATAVGRTAGG